MIIAEIYENMIKSHKMLHNTLHAFNEIDGAHLLMLSMSDSTDISLVLALIGFQ